MCKYIFFRQSIVKRLVVVLVILITISSKLFCTLHIRGSLDHIWPPILEKEHKTWIKIRQDIIERKGLTWYLKHPDKVYAFLLDNGDDCGLFVMGCDSILLYEIKKSIDVLSEAEDTLEVNYAYSCYTMNPEMNFFDKERYISRKYARDSFDRENSERELYYAKFLDSKKIYSQYRNPSRYWFLSDTTLYHRAKCIKLFSDLYTYNLIVIDSLRKQYVAECKKRNYDPLIFRPGSYSEPRIEDILSRVNSYDDENDPEIQLLHKYVKINDSIILNKPLSENMYDINYLYDHTKTANLSPHKFGRKPIKKIKEFSFDISGLMKSPQPIKRPRQNLQTTNAE